MPSLLVVAHGSRRAASNDEVRGLVERIRAQGAHYDRIECAFLELAEPSIPDGLRCLVETGAREIVVVPYFLSAGRHVVTDVPEEVEIVRREHPDVSIRIAAYLGAAEGIPELLLAQAGVGASSAG